MIIFPLTMLFIQPINQGHSATMLYDLKDLEVLEREKNFEEFLAHVNDIRPSERSKHWREMYQNMALGLIDYKIKTRDFKQTTYQQIEKIGRGSAMIDDEYYQFKRSAYAKKFFTECFSKSSSESDKNNCEKELSSFWYFSKKDPDLGLELAKILEEYKSKMPTWSFYEKATKDSISHFYCKKPEVQRAIMSKLYEETFTSSFNGDYKALIEKTVPDQCFDQLIAPLKTTMTSVSTNGLNKEMALNLLEAKKQISPEESELYAIIYLLDGPVVGDKMNLAWKKIENLSENFTKRELLLSQITKLELIPDKIFKDPNLPRHKAIIGLFAKNFPEFLNYYASACLKYLDLKTEENSNISSSFQCHEFLKAANENNQWVSDSVRSKYSSLKKN